MPCARLRFVRIHPVLSFPWKDNTKHRWTTRTCAFGKKIKYMKGSVIPKNSDYTVEELWELVHVLEDADAEHRRALCVLEFDANIQKKRYREMEERYTRRITQLEEEVAREKRRKEGPIDVDLVKEEEKK